MLKVLAIAFALLGAVAPAPYEKALGHLAKSDEASALATVTGAARDGSKDPKVYLLKGSLERKGGQLESAAASFRSGLRVAPDNSDLHLELAVTLWWLGKHEQALSSLDRCVLLTPSRAPAWQTRGRVLLSLDRTKEAELSLQKALSLEPGSAETYAALGTVYRAGLDKKSAASAYERALTLDPQNEEAKRGQTALQELHLWRLEATLRAFRTEDQKVRPGGEMMLRRQWTPSTFTHIRSTHEVRSWRTPSSVSAPSETDLMTRGEFGLLFEPVGKLKLLPAYIVTHSNLPLHQALSVEASYLLGKTVLLGSVRPGIDTKGQKDLLSQLGVQQVLGRSFWLMAQAFEYRNDAAQNSITGVATASWSPGKWMLKAGGGLGWYAAGKGYPVFGGLGYEVSHALTLRAEYNYFGGLFTQHQAGATVVWGF